VLWFTVWAVLVVGTLVGAFFLGRDLWRKATALFAELGRAADVFARLGDASARLGEADRTPPIRPQLFADRQPLRARVEELRRERGQRAERRTERHLATYARWRAYSR
jgi:hypothetical protein